jgi:hypothetical protein
MRKRLPSLAYLLLALPLGGMALVSACGGGDNTTGDAGPDATTDVGQPDVVKLDAAPDVMEASCTNDADLTAFLPSADASIDVDAGGLNISACTGCLKTSCGTDINACNQDCDCRQGVIDFVTCIAQQTSITTCATNALTSGNTNLQALIGCASSNCISACIPGDGGTQQDASSDGSADAASE